MRDAEGADHEPRTDDGDVARYYFNLLLTGSDQDKIGARAGLARIFEDKGMLEEAAGMLEGNVQAGIRTPALYTRLASLYRRLGRPDLATEAQATAASLADPGDGAPAREGGAGRRSKGDGEPGRPPAKAATPLKDNFSRDLRVVLLIIGIFIVILFVFGRPPGSIGGGTTPRPTATTKNATLCDDALARRRLAQNALAQPPADSFARSRGMAEAKRQSEVAEADVSRYC